MAKKRKFMRMDLIDKRNLAGYVFVLPFVIGFCIIFLPSIIQSFMFSVNDINVNPTGFDLSYIGFKNYIDAFTVDTNYRLVLLKTLSDLMINLPVILIFSFFIAILLNRKHFPGRTAIRVIFFLPVVVYAGVAASNGFTASYNPVTDRENAELALVVLGDLSGQNANGMTTTSFIGMAFSIQRLLESLNFSTVLMNFVLQAISRVEWIVLSSGVQILVFLAALQSIDGKIFEAAQVEGLTVWEMFWKITLPLISPMILVNTVYTVVDSFTNTRYAILDYIQLQSFGMAKYSYGSALSFIYFICMVIIIAVLNLLISRFVFYTE